MVIVVGLILCLSISSLPYGKGQTELPTVFEHYVGDGITSGLTANSMEEGFRLNGKPIRIFSASIHYFRVHPSYWRDRMRRARAAGIIAIDTYVPWNLHEPEKDLFDFGDQNRDMSMFLNLREYIQMAKEEDLLVILRPGPYICSEWDFGGLPSWLLHDPDMEVRSSNPAYHERVAKYLGAVLPQVTDLQFKQGGPIIMFQIENEYGAFGTADKEHLEFIKSQFEEHGLNELFFTSDSPLTARDKGALPEVLQTANFNIRPSAQLDALLQFQPDKPILIAEYWAGWFDHWLEPVHQITRLSTFTNVMSTVLDKYNGSINFYMFHGGTSFGFMAGANSIPRQLEPILPYYTPDISSYDYNAPLSEHGGYTPKYHVICNVTEAYSPVKLWRPEMPPENPIKIYPTLPLVEFISYNDILSQVPESHITSASSALSMESLPINNENGQSYGFVLYRINATVGNGSTIEVGRVRDMAMVLVDGTLQTKPLESIPNIALDFGYWTRENQSLSLNLETTVERNVDILVENMGRVNFGGPEDFKFQKGLHEGTVKIDGTTVDNFEIYSLEFKSAWIKNLVNFNSILPGELPMKGPLLVRSSFEIQDEPQDTFLDMSMWHKGVVFVNEFNMGRYFKGGPTQTMYIAAGFLKQGHNTITIFEQYTTANEIIFVDKPNLGPTIEDIFPTTEWEEEPTTSTSYSTTPEDQNDFATKLYSGNVLLISFVIFATFYY